MDLALVVMIIVGLILVGCSLYRASKLRQLGLNLNVRLSYFLQNNPCSRSTGQYVERYMPGADTQLILWTGKNEGPGGILKSENMTAEDAVKRLLAAANEIGEEIGIKATVVFK